MLQRVVRFGGVGVCVENRKMGIDRVRGRASDHGFCSFHIYLFIFSIDFISFWWGKRIRHKITPVLCFGVPFASFTPTFNPKLDFVKTKKQKTG